MKNKRINKINEVKMEKILENDRYLIHIIRQNWGKIVGEVIAKYSFPSFFSKEKLTIIVGNNLILNEIEIYKETILENINEQLNNNYVKEIYLKSGKIFSNNENYNTSIKEYNMELSEEEKEKIEKSFSKNIVNDTQDENILEIADRIKKIAINSKISEKILLEKGYKECERCEELFLGEGLICIKCKNELENEKMSKIKNIIEKKPFISIREISDQIEDITEQEFYRARDQLAEELTLIISELIEDHNMKSAEVAAEKYAIYRTGSQELFIINKIKDELLNRLTKFLKIKGKI